VGHRVDVFDANFSTTKFGANVGSFDGDYTLHDGFALGDVNGDGISEILIAGDEGHQVDIFDGNYDGNSFGVRLASFNGDYTLNDGFAVGDTNADGNAEVLVAGDVSHRVDVFNADFASPQFSQRTNFFDGNFTENDGFAIIGDRLPATLQNVPTWVQ